MATIKDVSRAAGVSVATVSRVLNDSGSVGEATRRRVLDAVQALHYTPNLTARNLRRNEHRVILILAPNLTNPYYAHIIAGIGKVAQEHGYASFLCNTAGRREQEEPLLEMLSRHQADGAILLASELGARWLLPYAQAHPMVQCSEFDPTVDIPHVSIDNYAAAHKVMDTLFALGHRRIGLISSENRYSSTALRRKGYRDAHKARSLPVRERYIRYATVDYSFHSGFEAARSLLTQERRPTALFAISDMLALGAIAGARELGFRVPQDVTVIGFDDVEQTTMFHPHVTTVAQPCFALGETAMEMLLEQLSGGSGRREVVLPFQLMRRESAGPCLRRGEFPLP